MYFFVTRESERKANQYEHLCNKLDKRIRDHDKHMNNAKEIFSAYKGTVSNFSNSKIPSNHFDPKREELTEKLSTYISQEEAKSVSLTSAKNQAETRKNYYINKVNQEVEQERQAKEAKRKEAKEKADKARKERERA
ncbi:hypothetical protein [Candidatus Enterococcus lemimoniae]|uniref:Mobilization protein n=1 Tax=Candidatus Enterococcus lemimoniae TaxID=1834167 RepID=A0ABZ2T8Q8_9ENTE|nr:hypothetical protein [Enterococcus sp. 12C11_DIV0727]OTO70914.1 hypothetical protein A5866_003164 [Enterococcus sp. 12C11_DIV0727]